MSLPEIEYCPGTLADGFSTYSPPCLRRLFNGKKVNHILSYDPPQQSEEVAEQFMENRTRISISGAQEKLSLVLEKNVLRLSKAGERGTYILKPIPRDLIKVDQVPANEHLTMQIARQVYGINTAENAMIFFKNGDPAYITKRFDVKDDNSKWGKEDFASLAGKTKDNAGVDFKFEYSYEEIGLLVQKYVPSWKIEIEKFFIVVIFNYLFSNGDAHLKNFALLENGNGDYVFSPFYDLVNTRIHVSDNDFALTKGLFANEFKSPAYKKNNHPSVADFRELGKRIGISGERIGKLVRPFLEKQDMVETLIARSFLNDDVKRGFLLSYRERRNVLNS